MREPRKAARKNPEKKKILKPPPILSEEERELYANSDFVELGYQRIERIRGIKKRNPEQNRRLDDHDSVEKRIADDPNALMREAHTALDHGTDLLLKLIRSRKLEQRSYYTDGEIAFEDDDAFSCLESRLDYLNRQLVRLANIGTPRARAALFYQAKALTEAFIRLAQAYPSDFISSAESALTMPSLRSRNPKFTADSLAIAKAIHLAEKHPAGMLTADKERIGEFCGYLVAKKLDSIAWERQQYQWDLKTLDRLKVFSETSDDYRDVTIEEYIRGRVYPTNAETMLISASLPEFEVDPKSWWVQRIKPAIRVEFERLRNNPSLNAALWNELCKLTDDGTDGAKWKALSDNCRNKVNQFARRSGAKVFT
jgi:hypothetical protein